MRELHLSIDARGEGASIYKMYKDSGFYEKYVRDGIIIDFGYKGGADFPPIFEEAIGIDIDTPGYNGKVIPYSDLMVGTIFASHVMEHIADYGSLLREMFRILTIGGTLIISVPMKDVYERKSVPLSNFNHAHLRFYTPMRLLYEIETQLDRHVYRILYLEERFENSQAFDRNIYQHANFPYEICCVLEKIQDLNEDNLSINERKNLYNYFLTIADYKSALIIYLKSLVYHGNFLFANNELKKIKDFIGKDFNKTINYVFNNLTISNKNAPFLSKKYLIDGNIENSFSCLIFNNEKFVNNDLFAVTIESIYNICHGRNSDPDGFTAMYKALSNGVSVEQLITNALHCNEFNNHIINNIDKKLFFKNAMILLSRVINKKISISSEENYKKIVLSNR